MSARRLEPMRLADVQPALRNPKDHADAEIAASMDRFGYVEVMVLDERTGRLVAGHGRRKQLVAAQAAGEAPPEGVEVGDDGEWLPPVLRGWESTNDDEAEAYLIASNRLTERGGWHDDVLGDLLADLQAADALRGTGYTSTQVDDLLAALGAVPSLDDLATQVGAHDSEALWPEVRVKVAPEVFARWQSVEAPDDVSRLLTLLDLHDGR